MVTISTALSPKCLDIDGGCLAVQRGGLWRALVCAGRRIWPPEVHEPARPVTRLVQRVLVRAPLPAAVSQQALW